MGETNSMQGLHSIVMIADALMNGDVDVDTLGVNITQLIAIMSARCVLCILQLFMTIIIIIIIIIIIYIIIISIIVISIILLVIIISSVVLVILISINLLHSSRTCVCVCVCVHMCMYSVRSKEGNTYLERGYSLNNPCQTLNFALDDFCVSELASTFNVHSGIFLNCVCVGVCLF